MKKALCFLSLSSLLAVACNPPDVPNPVTPETESEGGTDASIGCTPGDCGVGVDAGGDAGLVDSASPHDAEPSDVWGPDAAPVFSSFPVPTASAALQDITLGPDGNLWFTELHANKIGRITPSGTVTEYSISAPGGSPYGITTGPDGNLWFTETSSSYEGAIGKITTSGTLTLYPMPTNQVANQEGIATGRDGNLWFTEHVGAKIGRCTTSGGITEYTIDNDGGLFTPGPSDIALGPDGYLWFTDDSGFVGKITTTGSLVEFPAPGSNARPWGITAGPDGEVWFTDFAGSAIVRVDIGNYKMTSYVLPLKGAGPAGITVGPDGNLWFAEYQVGKIGRITPSGAIAEYPIPGDAGTGFRPTSITSANGSLWFTESGANAIGRLTP